MTLKILGILIPIPLLFFASTSRAENTRIHPLQQDAADPQETFSKDALSHLQDIHNFESIFDDSYLGGMPYERVE